MDTRPQTVQHILDHRTFQEELNSLGFDPKVDEFTLAGIAGPLTVLIHRHPIDIPDGRLSILEYRLMVAPTDREGDIAFPGKERIGSPRIIAIQVASVHGLNTGQDSHRITFEKTYAVGTLSLPEKIDMVSDMAEMIERYDRQVENIKHFIQETLPAE